MQWSEIRQTVIGGVIVGVCLIGADQYVKRTNDQSDRIANLPTKQWMRTQFASKDDVQNYAWRLTQLEADAKDSDGRQRAMKDIINRLCQIHDMSCATRNALWQPNNPYPRPNVYALRYAYHKTPAVLDGPVAWSSPVPFKAVGTLKLVEM